MNFLDLAGLISQTEYYVTVTPVYREGSGLPMLGSAVTGQWGVLQRVKVTTFLNQLCLCAIRGGSCPQEPAVL